MGKLKKMTLKRAFYLIVLVTTVCVIFLSVVTVRRCSKVHDQITFSHAFVTRGALIEKEPLTVLRRGISHIANNDLDFTIGYQKQDELGELCTAFESMRQELVKNNRYMWDLVDERRKINASICHHLRTPITVIKGYSEYLDKNTGKGTLTKDGTQEIQSLEDLRLEYQEISLCDFEEELCSQLSVIAEQNQTEIHILSKLQRQTVTLSSAAVFRIVENIVANALRYCKEKIDINISFSQPFLSIVITDDNALDNGAEVTVKIKTEEISKL